MSDDGNKTLDERGTFAEFSLLGGPLHRLGALLGLVRGGSNTFGIGLALGASLWAVLLALALWEGLSEQILSRSVLAGHVRLLLVIPLLFLCETWIDPRITEFVGASERNGLVPLADLPALAGSIERVVRWRDAWLPEAVCLLAAVTLSLLASNLALPGTTTAFDPARGGAMTLTGQWYWFVCMPLFRFLLCRWLLRLGLWCFLLWRLSRLDLRLVPTNPDGVGGLGYLEVVHMDFAPLLLGLSAIEAASLAEEIVGGTATFEAIYPGFVMVLAAGAVLFLGPLCMFALKLRACKLKGLREYGALATRYVSDFDHKWLRGGAAPGESLLGTPDLQSLADLSNSVGVVRGMRVVPASRRIVSALALAALLPFLPLLLLKFPVEALAEQLLRKLLAL